MSDAEGQSSRSSPQIISRDNGTVTIRGFEPGSGSSSSRPIRASVDPTGAPYPSDSEGLRRRQSFAERIGSIGNAGGVNSFNKFAASWQRAAGFYEIPPVSRSLSSQTPTDEEHDEAQDHVPDLEHGGPRSRNSLLRAAIDRDRRSSDSPFDDDQISPESATGTEPDATHHQDHASQSREDSLFPTEPQWAASYGTSHGSNYGSLPSRLSASAPRNSVHMEPGSLSAEANKEREPLLAGRKVSQDVRRASVVTGHSTLPQTIFNSVNVLVGVGMLSLPLGIRYSGWLIGLLFFLFSAVATSYTAKLLAKCLDVDASLVTFADIAYGSFGHRARIFVSILFTLELLAACVALVILFADSIDLLIPGWGVTAWKIVCGGILIPLSFLPLRFLSFTSILGIACCIIIVMAVFIDGLIKPHAFGSLRDPAPTYLFPQDWKTLPLAFGLLMAPWGGHSVFPNIYRDMRHPKRYSKAVNITYVFTYLVEVALAIAGYLMFGDNVRDEITANVFVTKGYPHWLSIIIIVAITIVPLTKVPLNSRPIISTIDIFCGVDERVMAAQGRLTGMTGTVRGIIKLTIRILTPVVLAIVAILVPSFDRVMSLLGSLACFSICIILPCAFHLKIFGKDSSLKQRILDWTLLVVCSILATVGTVCSFLPKAMLGAELNG